MTEDDEEYESDVPYVLPMGDKELSGPIFIGDDEEKTRAVFDAIKPELKKLGLRVEALSYEEYANIEGRGIITIAFGEESG